MNTVLCVTLSVPLFMVLAGFTANAHGLTTFGKSQNNQQNVPPPDMTSKPCSTQQACAYIKNTTCISGYCKCGDNHFPRNGECKSQFQGPNHICTKNEDCIEYADCIPVKDLPSSEVNINVFTQDMSICKCQEGYDEYFGTCGGSMNYATMSMIFIWLTGYLLFN